MQYFYDGQIRRYISQVIRVFSNFVVKYGNGTLVRIPVMYGDADRQVASIIRNNSENAVNSTPRIGVYVTSLSMSRDRLADQTFVDKVHIREREILDGTYTQAQGKNHTIERLMPTPFELTFKVDIWSANTEQKLQILEQLLVLFNPSLELQTTDNYVDWTSLTVLDLHDVSWSSRQVPVGNSPGGDPIDIATLTVKAPIWINPPVKVKHLGVITKIITSLNGGSSTSDTYIEGLGQDPEPATTSMTDFISVNITTFSDYSIEVYSDRVILLSAGGNTIPTEPNLEIEPERLGPTINWQSAFDQYPGQYVAGSSRIYVTQNNGTQVSGTIAIDAFDNSILRVNWNPDTLVTNTGLDSTGLLDYQPGYNLSTCYRANSPGTFDAIVNPLTFNPLRPKGEHSNQPIDTGTRYLLVEDIGDLSNEDGADAWKSTSGDDFIAKANDIVEWQEDHWAVVFNSSQNSRTMVWQTNIYKSSAQVQYLWNGVSWVKSFDGLYRQGQWSIVL